jgi:hypothetical protein
LEKQKKKKFAELQVLLITTAYPWKNKKRIASHDYYVTYWG